jgi:hypothetical protein
MEVKLIMTQINRGIKINKIMTNSNNRMNPNYPYSNRAKMDMIMIMEK